jgi:O-antigen biosynthesis protein
LLFVQDFLTDQLVLRNLPPETKPLVSVILPTYNRNAGGFLERAISSVLSQTLTDFELLVMDDGSADGSYDLIEYFRARDSRLIHVVHEHNSGLPALRVNEGIELAQGKYLAFQFDDDCWRPNALEALVGEAKQHFEPIVVVGNCHCKGTAERILPSVKLNLVNLYEKNLLANNSVLFPRFLVNDYGMYDCHIGMRRKCDWDLWLRYMKHIPFVVIEQVVAEVNAYKPDSIGMTVPWDLALFRFFHDIQRNSLLTPDRWRNYEVDSLQIGEVEIDNELRRRLYDEQVVPYYLKFRHHFPQVEGFSNLLPPEPKPKKILYTKYSYDVTNDVTIGHYDVLSNRRSHFKMHFQPLSQVDSNWMAGCNLLLLMRTVEEQAKRLLSQALKGHIPVGLYLDDDLLTFYEIGPQYNYLAPGTTLYQNLLEILWMVDTVWTTSSYIAESVKAFSPRHIPHNNSVREAWLPTEIRPYEPERSMRIGYVGSGGYRIEEFMLIWNALQKISKEYSSSICFEFWGLDVSSLPKLHSPIKHVPFTFSYFEYIHRLQRAEFDIILTPLLSHPRPRLGKSLIKYYETAVAGAIGIFSDVPQYERLPANLTCLKAENTAEAWYDALRIALTMPSHELERMRQRLVAHVREEFTERAQIHLHEAALRATEFHAKTRTLRQADGRPRVIYVWHEPFLGGAEIQLWRRLQLARKYGIEPIVVLPRDCYETDASKQIREILVRQNIQLEFAEYTCFTEPRSPSDYWKETERKDIEELLNRCNPALVHTVTFIPSFGQICAEKKIPHVATLHQVDDNLVWADGKPEFAHASLIHSDSLRYAKLWSRILGVEKVCTWGVVPEDVFTLGQTRYLESLGEIVLEEKKHCLHLALAGTLQARKMQLETIEAIGRLSREGLECQLDLYGYTHFYPKYLQRCKELLRTQDLEDRVIFHGFEDNFMEILKTVDVMLCLSISESFPGAIAEAMAAGVLVVATPVGGIPEIIIDGVSGILCAGTSVEAMVDGIRRALLMTQQERKRIIEQARRVARSEFHPHRTATEMMAMYNRAIDLTSELRCLNTQPPQQSSIPQATARYGIVESLPNPPTSHLLVNGKVIYHLSPQHPNWMGLDMLIGTHQQTATGVLKMRVLSEAGHPLREISVDLVHARDNDWLGFQFPPIANSNSIRFVIEFTITNPGLKTRISFYENNPRESAARRLLRCVGLRLPGNTLYYRAWYAK